MKRIRAMRKRFHPDFTHPPTPHILESSDGVRFYFPLALLTPVSTFFEDIATLPTPPGDNIIPLYSARSDALALALKLVAAAHFSPSPPHLPWPSRQTLKHLSIIVDAYDMPMIPEALIDATPPLDPLVSANVCYERVIWAAAEDVPGLYTIIRHTALHRLQDQDKWIVNALSKFPYAMAHLKSCRRELEKQIEEAVKELRIPAAHTACPSCFSSDEIRRLYRWGRYRSQYIGCGTYTKAGHWSRGEIDDWLDRLADQLCANVAVRIACPRVAGTLFPECLVLRLDKFYRDVEELVPDVHLPRLQVDRTGRQSWVKTYPYRQ